MKKIVKNIILFSSVIAIFASCKKDEHRITYEGGTPPVLTPSSLNDLVLTKATATAHAISFSWTNPDYKFTTGVSSQDVTYYLQVDTLGSGFTTPNNTSDIAIANELHIDLNDSVLNHSIALIGEHGLVVDVPHRIEFRLKATLHGGNAVLYSNSDTVTVTPYLDVAVPIPPTGELYLVGSGAIAGWDNNPPLASQQQFTKVSDVEYTLVAHLAPGLQIKFLSTLGAWQPQYGLQPQTTATPTGGALGFNMGGGSDPTEIPTPDAAGNYKITVLFVPGKYKLELQ